MKELHDVSEVWLRELEQEQTQPLNINPHTSKQYISQTLKIFGQFKCDEIGQNDTTIETSSWSSNGGVNHACFKEFISFRDYLHFFFQITALHFDHNSEQHLEIGAGN